MASTLRMRTAISSRQWQLWKLFFLGGGKPAHQKPFTGEASAKHSFKRQLRRKLDPGQLKFDT